MIEMAQANLGWGYTKIRDALRTGLKIEIGRTSVANILAEAGIEPAPERQKKRSWKRFEDALGVPVRLRFLQRRGPRDRGDGSLHGLLRHRDQEPGGRDCWDSRRSQRGMDEAGSSQSDRSGRWVSPDAKYLIDDRDPLFMRRSPRSWGRGVSRA